MALVIANHTFGTDECLAVLAEILGFLLRMLKTELFSLVLLLFLQTLLSSCIWDGISLSRNMQTWTYATKVVHFLFVVDVVYQKERSEIIRNKKGQKKS